ncbi:unnamed protein product [Rhizopus stolonifer]
MSETDKNNFLNGLHTVYSNEDYSSNQVLNEIGFDTFYQNLQPNSHIYPSPSHTPVNALLYSPIHQQQPPDYLPYEQIIPYQRCDGHGFYPVINDLYHPYENNRKLDETIKKKPKSRKRKNKLVDPNALPKPKRNTGLNKPLILSSVLSDLLDGTKELSRPELVQQLWKYIKEHDLQDPSDRRFILCDEKLKRVFEQDRVNSFGMNKDLSAHLTKK